MASEKGLSSAAQSLRRALSILGATLSPRCPRSCCANAATAPFVLQVMRWTVTPGAKRPHELDTRRAAQADPQLRSRCHWQCWCFASAACKARCHPPTASCPRKRLLQVFWKTPWFGAKTATSKVPGSTRRTLSSWLGPRPGPSATHFTARPIPGSSPSLVSRSPPAPGSSLLPRRRPFDSRWQPPTPGPPRCVGASRTAPSGEMAASAPSAASPASCPIRHPPGRPPLRRAAATASGAPAAWPAPLPSAPLAGGTLAASRAASTTCSPTSTSPPVSEGRAGRASLGHTPPSAAHAQEVPVTRAPQRQHMPAHLSLLRTPDPLCACRRGQDGAAQRA